MLTLALPKSRLLDRFVEFASGRGLPLEVAARPDDRTLVRDAAGMRLLLLKDADVPVYVAQGVADAGVAGLDQILERGEDVLRLVRFPFGHCRLCLIARDGLWPGDGSGTLAIASKYPRLAAEEAQRRGYAATIIPLAGSVELAARLGLADAVVDVVETGRTLRENGLHPVEEWLQVAPYLIANRSALFFKRNEIGALRRALGGER